MRPLLIDTDAFTKLELSNLLDAAVAALGTTLQHCRRLPELPRMLQRGRLFKKLGEIRSAKVRAKAVKLDPTDQPDAEILSRLTAFHGVDPGEAHLLALAAKQDVLVLTGDKRALSAIRGDKELTDVLRGKVVTLETVLLRLCQTKGEQAIRDAVNVGFGDDVMVSTVFSPGNKTPMVGLKSYIAACKKDVDPLVLWPEGEP